MTTMKSVVTSGETEDGQRDGDPGWGGVASQTTSSEKKNPKPATETTKGRYPQGCPRGGGDEHPNRTEPRMTTQENGITTTIIQCICGKTCKNEKGLKIHQGRMKCLTAVTVTQHT